MPTSVQPVYLIADDAEHPDGQVLVDDVDCVVQIAFRSVATSGTLPLPDVEYLSDAPRDGESYGRKDGAWVPLSALVSGVSSVNGQFGEVTLDAADVGADATGTAAAAVTAHAAGATPHATLGGVDSLSFDMTAGIAVGEGQMAWNATDRTVDLGLPGGSVLQVGQEVLVRVLNNTGATLNNGDMVYITGASGQRRQDQAPAGDAGQVRRQGAPAGLHTDDQRGHVVAAGVDHRGLSDADVARQYVAQHGLLLEVDAPLCRPAVRLSRYPVIARHVPSGWPRLIHV
ncbi:hypothetical protein D3C78_947920 [compost metagenome]